MRIILFGLISVIALGALAWWFFTLEEYAEPVTPIETAPAPETEVVTAGQLKTIAEKADLIVLESPQPGEVAKNPLQLRGFARGYWFFEASFPVSLHDFAGNVLARGVAEAEEDWMAEEMVPFTATINFKSPYIESDPLSRQRGTIVLRRDNPSDEPENDDSLIIPVLFTSRATTSPFSISIPYEVEIYDGITVLSNVRSLDLSNRNLSGSLKAEVGELTKVAKLNLSENQFTNLPAELGKLTQLTELNLSNNPITGLPYELGNLQNLAVLDLRGTEYAETDLEVILESLPENIEVITDATEEATEVEELEE